MTICNNCGGLIADIGSNHNCQKVHTMSRPRLYPDPQPRIGLKCDLCGSTAIDHTEADCSLNSTLRRANALPKSKLAPDEEENI